MPKIAWVALTLLTIAVFVLLVLLFVIPAPGENGGTTPTSTPSSQPFSSANVNVASPLPNANVSSTFAVVGEARGPWYFEASFPVQVRDPANNLVGQGIAQAQGEWMTTDFVPFEATVTVAGYTGPADLVLLKDNPSGLPENDDAVFFPITVQ